MRRLIKQLIALFRLDELALHVIYLLAVVRRKHVSTFVDKESHLMHLMTLFNPTLTITEYTHERH